MGLYALTGETVHELRVEADRPRPILPRLTAQDDIACMLLISQLENKGAQLTFRFATTCCIFMATSPSMKQYLR